MVHGATAVAPKEIDSSARISLTTTVVLLGHVLLLWDREVPAEHELFPNAAHGEPRGTSDMVSVYHYSGLLYPAAGTATIPVDYQEKTET